MKKSMLVSPARKRDWRIARRTAAVGIAAALALSACSSSGDGPPSDESAGGSAGSGLTKVTMAESVSVTTIPFEIAKRKGIFEKNGLDVEIVSTSNIALLPAAVVAGQYDFASSVAPIYLSALSRNLPLVVTAGGQLEDENNHNLDLMVKNDSPIKTAADLAGKTVGTAAIQGNYSLCMKYWLKTQNLDPEAPKLTVVPLADMKSQLDSGRIQAALQSPPLSNQMLAEGYRSIGDPCLSIGMPQVGTFQISNKEWANSHKDEVAAMQKSIEDANTYIQQNPDEAAQITADFTKIPLDVIKTYKNPQFAPNATQSDLENWAKVLTTLGVLKQAPDLSSAIVTP